MKFGGTSVADAQRIRAVADVVGRHVDRRPVVVVSALGGVTDRLVEAVGVAGEGDLERLDPIVSDIERRYRWAASAVETTARRHSLELEIADAFEDLRSRLRSVRILGEGTPRTIDGIYAFGDLVAARIVAATFQDLGLDAEGVDARQLIVTDGRHGDARPDTTATAARCTDELLPLLERGVVPVVAGFVGATTAGETSTLGRGGSDTTASLIARVLQAEELQIWTDVDGLMTADPRSVPTARTLPGASFVEAAEMAFHGARVLCPASIAPAVAASIPVRVLNTMQPDGAGTRIEGDAPDRPGFPFRLFDPPRTGHPGAGHRRFDAGRERLAAPGARCGSGDRRDAGAGFVVRLHGDAGDRRRDRRRGLAVPVERRVERRLRG